LHKPFYFIFCSAVILALGLNLTGCRSDSLEPPATTTPVVLTPTGQPAPTNTSVPTPTSQPQLVLLYTPAGSDTGLAGELQAVLAELAARDGLEFETRTELQEADLNTDVRVLVAVPPDPGVGAWAANHPEVQFLAVGIPGLQPAANLSLLGSQGDRPDQQGFLAGYLSAVLTPDWRTGVITPAGTPSGRAAQLAFSNGLVFFCGLCRPSYPPFVQYPQFVELSPGSSQEEQQAAVEALTANAVKTVYVFPGAGDEALLDSLAQAGIHLIGGVAPPPALREHWVATVRPDLASAMEEIWPSLLNGQGGASLDMPVVITDRNAALFSPGRQRLAEKLLADLLANYVDTGVDPLTGEAK
jgi:hypothetical protein